MAAGTQKSRGARRARLAIFATFPAWVAGACKLYDTSLLVAAPRDAGEDAPTVDADVRDAPDAPIDPCPHARGPSRNPGGGAAELPPFFMALRTLRYESDAGATVGFDLDGVCTCFFDAGPSCTPRGTASQACDDSEGRDNSLGTLLRRVGSFSPAFRDVTLSPDLERGTSGFLLEVRGYNGEANDANVFVAVYSSSGIAQPPRDGGADASVDAGPPAVLAKWDGADRFRVTPESIQGGVLIGGSPIPAFADENAYVADGVLVAVPVRGAPVRGTFAGLDLEVSDVRIVGRLTKDTRGYSLLGAHLGGRTSTASMLLSLSALPDPVQQSGFLCGPSIIYQSLKREICSAADITLQANAAELGRCDAVSLGFAFEAQPVLLGGVAPLASAPRGCGAGYTDDCP